MKALDKMWNGSGWYGFIWEKSTSTIAISLTKSWHPVQGFRPSYTHNKNVTLQGPASMRQSRGGNRVSQPPTPPLALKIHKNRVPEQYWSKSAENHKAAKPASYVGPSSARQRNAGGPMMAPLYSSGTLIILKKKRRKWTPSGGAAHVSCICS